MSDLKNRIDTQRCILKIINSRQGQTEPLFGLSMSAIERWYKINKIESESKIVILILELSDMLCFLANKSQEQITDEYVNLSRKITNKLNCLKAEI